jgi:hypothetical protein
LIYVSQHKALTLIAQDAKPKLPAWVLGIRKITRNTINHPDGSQGAKVSKLMATFIKQ